MRTITWNKGAYWMHADGYDGHKIAFESIADAQALALAEGETGEFLESAPVAVAVAQPGMRACRESCRECGAPGHVDGRGLGISCGCAAE